MLIALGLLVAVAGAWAWVADAAFPLERNESVAFSGPSHERDSIVSYQAQRFGMDPKLAIAISHAENWGGDSAAVHPRSGAVGIMQVMPFWADSFRTECGIEPLTNRISNACRGVLISMKYFKDCGDWDCALQYYVGAVCTKRDGPWRCEQKQKTGERYVHAVLRNLHRTDLSVNRDAVAMGGWRRDSM